MIFDHVGIPASDLKRSGESDIVVNSLKFFLVATPEDFRDLQLAAASSPPGSPKSVQREAFLASHPKVEKVNATLGIEPSDDQLIAARDGSYAVSFGRRSANP